LFFGEQFGEVETEKWQEDQGGEPEEEMKGEGTVKADGRRGRECIDDFTGVFFVLRQRGDFDGEFRMERSEGRGYGDGGSAATDWRPSGSFRSVVRLGHWESWLERATAPFPAIITRI
jgi:hypothetical protein